jgi:hypothetical protein
LTTSEPLRVIVELLDLLELVGLGAQLYGDAIRGVLAFFACFSIYHLPKVRLQVVNWMLPKLFEPYLRLKVE